MPLPINRDLAFFHRFEQSRLRAGRHAIDFINQQQICEHRAPVKSECASGNVQHIGTEQVSRHQVRRALHALETCIQSARQSLHTQSLRKPRDAFDKGVTSTEQRDESAVDQVALADDDFRKLSAAMRYHFRNGFHTVQSLSLALC